MLLYLIAKLGSGFICLGNNLLNLSNSTSPSLNKDYQRTDEQTTLEKPTSSRVNDASTNKDAEIELLTLGQTMTVLERQISEVNQDIETSIVGISQGFQGMAKQAQAAISTAGTTAGEKPENKIHEMQEVVTNLIQHMGESCDSLSGASQRLTDVEKRLDVVESVLRDIEKIASQSRLVALNGEIEAKRLGDAGKAFAVVAAETKQLSQHATETSRSIRELLSELTSVVTSTTSDLIERSKSDAQRLNSSKQEAEALLEYIESDHYRMTASLVETEKISRELQSNIATAVMSLQFQDRVSQRIHHVVDSLKVMRSRAEEISDPELKTEAEARSQVLLKSLAGQYTMESERNAMMGSHAASTSSATVDVELF
ncbi:methyl-accepting chemotaxis protein [Pirellulaceae bacterium SH449]